MNQMNLNRFVKLANFCRFVLLETPQTFMNCHFPTLCPFLVLNFNHCKELQPGCWWEWATGTVSPVLVIYTGSQIVSGHKSMFRYWLLKPYLVSEGRYELIHLPRPCFECPLPSVEAEMILDATGDCLVKERKSSFSHLQYRPLIQKGDAATALWIFHTNLYYTLWGERARDAKRLLVSRATVSSCTICIYPTIC